MNTLETAPAQRRSAELETRIATDPQQFRVLTGDRPTGPLHLGHYFGTLANRVRLQRQGVPMLVVIADYQVLTDRETAANLDEHVLSLITDHLAAGLDPDEATIFTHSAITALNQLLLPLLSLVTMPELQRNPTVKDEIAHSAGNSVSGLMLTYPAHQAADILFCKANLVPVGQDQLPHLELTRTLAHRFNDRHAPLFDQPDALLSAAPLLLGTDGTKMSKSRGNAITLRASADETARLIRGAKTDSQRHITYDPDNRPEVASLLRLASLCTGTDPLTLAADIGSDGAGALKRVVTEAVNEHLAPLRAARQTYAADEAGLRRILAEGNRRATGLAETTLEQVRTAMGTTYSTSPSR